MTANVTVVRHNDRLDRTLERLAELRERWARVGPPDRGTLANHSLYFTRQLGLMLELAHVIALGARLRDESRGAHYKPAFPARDDARFLKTTRAVHTPQGPRIVWDEVDIGFVAPRPRTYEEE